MLLGLLLATLLCVTVIWRALTHPRRRTYATAVARKQPGSPDELDLPRDFDQWTVRSRGVDLHAWTIRGDRPEGPVVIVTHGWGNGRIGALVRTPALASEASWVVLWDQRGHGDTRGASTLGIRGEADLLAIIQQVRTDTPEADRCGVVLMGWSMGAGIAIESAATLNALASGVKVLGVIAESPYIDPHTPARAVLRGLGLPVRWVLPLVLRAIGLRYGINPIAPHVRAGSLGFDRLGDAERLGTIPLLVLHGDADTMCPIYDGIAIADAAHNGTCMTIPGGGHNDLWTDPNHEAACTLHVGTFLRLVAAERSDVSDVHQVSESQAARG